MNQSWTKWNRLPLAATALACFVAAALAVNPGEWVHQTEADFQAAELDHTVVTNLGRVELSRASDKLAELPEAQTIIYDIARTADGTTYLAIGPTGVLAKLVEGEDEKQAVETIAEFEKEQIFALFASGDALWVAVSGAESRIEKHVGGEVAQTLALADVRYVWDLLEHDGKLWVATGTEGQVLVLDPEVEQAAAPTVALDTEQKNVLCLAIDAAGKVYAGTDGEGLVYRITPAPDDLEHPYKTFVMYDAAEPEIGALLVGADGTLYAGTADAQQARPGRLAEAIAEEKGEAQPPDGDGDGDGDGDAGDGEEGAGDGDGEGPPDAPDIPDAPPAPEPLPEDPADADAADAPDAPAAEPAQPTKPGPRQYNTLRKVVAQRLAEARKGRPMQAGRNVGGQALRPRRPGGGSSSGAPAQPKEGNAVYAIAPDGFVREVFRESVMILRLARADGKLIIATGNEGQVYRVDPGAEEVTVLADLDVQQVPAMIMDGGRVMIGTANPGRLVKLGAGYAESGTFTSDPLDAAQPSMWGAMQIQATLPDGATVSVQTRSGNLADPEQGHWSDWTEPAAITPPAQGLPTYVKVQSPAARYLQYRLALGSAGEHTPAVSRVAMKYLMPNMRPKIASLKAAYPENNNPNGNGPVAKVVMNIEWEATDPNGDRLGYTLETRKLGTDQPFIELETDIDATQYEWDTRAMPDGRYELRLTASDALDNVPDQAEVARRVSAAVLIDNSAPAITDLAGEPGDAAGTFDLTAKATDELSVIAEFRYSLNGKTDWQAVLPEDMIFDSTSEAMSFTIRDLSPGTHVVTLRAADALGNVRHASITAKVAE